MERGDGEIERRRGDGGGGREVVGARGFEPPTSRSRTVRSNQAELCPEIRREGARILGDSRRPVKRAPSGIHYVRSGTRRRSWRSAASPAAAPTSASR